MMNLSLKTMSFYVFILKKCFFFANLQISQQAFMQQMQLTQQIFNSNFCNLYYLDLTAKHLIITSFNLI